jgi:ElaB/YqjD/DUF883 family membrane-anchored ribosome-binding protein
MANPTNRGVNFPEQRGQETGKSSNQGMGGTVESLKEKASDVASGVASTAEQAWDTTRHAVQSAASTVASATENAWEGAISFMRRYPLATFAMGAGFGFLLCGLWTMRRS